MDNSNVRVYAKHLITPTVIHQACIGDWTRQPQLAHENDPSEDMPHVDVVFGKGSYLSLHRFVADHADQDGRPSGSLELIHEQPVFGTIKDIKSLYCNFPPESRVDTSMNMEIEPSDDVPRLGYLPSKASPTVLVATSDSGILSFVTYHQSQSLGSQGHFYIIKEVDISEPGLDYAQVGARIAIDPTSRLIAIAALQDRVKLVILKDTTRQKFDPIDRISEIDLNGTIVGMEFLTPSSKDKDPDAILAVLLFNKDTSRYHLATFHIGLKNQLSAPLDIQVGASQLGLNGAKSILHLKSLPNFPASLVYIDEERITLVTIEGPSVGSETKAPFHTHHQPEQLLKRESPNYSESPKDSLQPTATNFPLISACATPPRSPYHTDDQTLYLGSDTAEMYRINIRLSTRSIHFELASGERPVGGMMMVLARQQVIMDNAYGGQGAILNTDYVIYAGDQGDGGILAIKEEESGIDLFAIAELPNSSPVLDFCTKEPSYPGGDTLYMCSGMKSEGSIQRVRSGIAVESSVSSGSDLFEGSTGLWGVREKQQDAFDSFLVVSFIQSTKVMRNVQGENLEDISNSCGFNLSQATIGAGRLKNGTIYQVHRSGIIAVNTASGASIEWHSNDGVIASVCWVKEGMLIVGQIASGTISLVALECIEIIGEDGIRLSEFKVRSTRDLKTEPTTIHCWQELMSDGATNRSTDGLSNIYCCVGTLEPSVLIFQVLPDEIRDVYSESLAQTGRESVSIPHSVCLLKNGTLTSKLLVGLRDGSIISYDWSSRAKEMDHASSKLSNPRQFKIGVLPVNLAYDIESSAPKTLVLSDKLCQAEYGVEFGIQPILFDGKVTQACSFQYTEQEQPGKPSFAFIVDHHDMQLVSLEGMNKHHRQTLWLGQTPRRILDVTSKRLLLVASVSDGFPFASSTLHLIDPERVSSEEGCERQHIVAQFELKQGEAVYCLAEWKIQRPNNSDAIYICIGTGLFSPTGTEVSAAAPKSGRLVVLSIKQSKKAERRLRKFELDLRWTMTMPAPVFAISTFQDMKLLISNGPVLKLLALDLEKKSLVEKASFRERWPIVQISTQGSMICTGSRRESMCFYEYRSEGDAAQSVHGLRFLKSARSSRMVSDCMALSPEFAVSVDMSGGIFGLGYTKDDVNNQFSLEDRFSFHIGEVANRIRLAKAWPADERTLHGISLSQRTDSTGNEDGGALTKATPVSLKPSLLASWILSPWTPDHSALSTSANLPLTQTSAPSAAHAPQALVACTLTGSVLGFWRLQPLVYSMLSSLQSVLRLAYEGRPILGNSHDRFRSLSAPGSNTIDGDFVARFLTLDHSLKVHLVVNALGLERMVEAWVEQQRQSGVMTAQEEKVFVGSHEQVDVVPGVQKLFLPPYGQAQGLNQGADSAVRVITRLLEFLQGLDWHQ